MAEFYNRRKRIRTEEFSTGDVVSVAIPKLDRSSTDLLRLPSIVEETHGTKIKSYTLATPYGVLNKRFPSGDLQHFSENMQWDHTKVLSLREAARMMNPKNKFLKTSCRCTGTCANKRCPCRQNEISCSTHCHPLSTCTNQECNSQESKETLIMLLSEQERRQIDDNSWLNDKHMAAANILLKKTLPSTSGLEDTVLQQNMSFVIPIGEFVQFFHVSNNHWITISNRGQPPGTVCIYDSLLKKPSKATVKMIAHYCHSPEKNIRLNVMNVSRQPNTYDCGLYAIAFATSLLHGEDPTKLDFVQNRLRKHFGKCIDKGIISPFPSFAILRQKDVYSLDTVPIYCECRCPDDGKQMIECEKCKEWFHAACVTIKSAKNWKCTFCLNTVKDSS